MCSGKVKKTQKHEYSASEEHEYLQQISMKSGLIYYIQYIGARDFLDVFFFSTVWSLIHDDHSSRQSIWTQLHLKNKINRTKVSDTDCSVMGKYNTIKKKLALVNIQQLLKSTHYFIIILLNCLMFLVVLTMHGLNQQYPLTNVFLSLSNAGYTNICI